MKKWSDEKNALALAIAYTCLAIFTIVYVLYRALDPLQIVVAVSAVAWWIYYAKLRKKRQEENNDE
ncbi:MAG: RnfABCDGE type electron transport complex subunit D [Lawsonibacter sp.]|nr:RnfABCDGE type electron transport complex subunit D [Lawsonibacter sp.]